MTLIDNAREVLTRAWSVRLALLVPVFTGLDALNSVLPFLDGFIPSRTFAVLTALCGAGAALARVVAQPKTLPKS